ncbi:MAG: hypothetical protein NTW86_03315, partial [Candidatus Sumerlaeota bacterium]|nr:hypothetical protein [Candidatus Sumerlaeota bacterium]
GGESVESIMDEVSSLDMDAAFDTPPGGGVPKETAQRLIDSWDEIEKQIPEDALARRRQFDFYHAVAAFVLDRKDEARTLFQSFLDRYGKEEAKDYLDSARKYLELLTANAGSAPAE